MIQIIVRMIQTEENTEYISKGIIKPEITELGALWAHGKVSHFLVADLAPGILLKYMISKHK